MTVMFYRAAFFVAFLGIAHALFGQWTVIDTFASHTQWSYEVDFQLRPVSDGSLYYFYTDDPPSPSTEAEVRVYKTLNDGENWSSVLSYNDFSYQAYDLEFPHSDTGFFTFNYMSMANLVRTNSGGNNWTAINYFDGPADICFINGSKGYGVFGDRFMRYENDTMQVVDTLDWSLWTAKAAFNSQQTGYMICSMAYGEEQNKVIRTIDDGESWQLVLEDDERIFYDIQAPSENSCYIGCDDGHMYKSDDKGETWQLITLGSVSNVISVCFLDDETGYALDAGHTVHKTSDGGASWTQQQLPDFLTGVRQINMVSDSIGYVHASISGYEQLEVLVKTSNGGITSSPETRASQTDIQVFPVPFADAITIRLPGDHWNGGRIDLLNLQGKRVYQSGEFHGPETILDLSFLEPGVYCLIIGSKSLTSVRKIIKGP
jgi:photosystem II stability/assembly factor-like uncharacterized protein